MFTMEMLKVQFYFFLFFWWSSEQHVRVDLCRAGLCSKLCPGHLSDPQKVTVFLHPSISLSEIMILSPEHTEIY